MKVNFEYTDDAEKAEVLTALKAAFRLESDEDIEARAKELALNSLKQAFFRGALKADRELGNGSSANVQRSTGEVANLSSSSVRVESSVKTADEIKAAREARIAAIRARVRPNTARARAEEIFSG